MNLHLILMMSKIDEIWLNLQQAHEDTQNFNKEVMNDFCSKIGNICLESKEKSFENKHFVAISNNNKRWFGRQCQSARRKYHIAPKINQRHLSTTNHRKLKKTSQSYKQKMNFHMNKFNRNIPEKLRKLKSKNPKEYWNIINSLDRNNENSSIDLDTLYNFF